MSDMTEFVRVVDPREADWLNASNFCYVPRQWFIPTYERMPEYFRPDESRVLGYSFTRAGRERYRHESEHPEEGGPDDYFDQNGTATFFNAAMHLLLSECAARHLSDEPFPAIADRWDELQAAHALIELVMEPKA